jgi:hypothetical protein
MNIAWGSSSTFPYVFITWCFIKYSENFIFTFTVNLKYLNLIKIPDRIFLLQCISRGNYLLGIIHVTWEILLSFSCENYISK